MPTGTRTSAFVPSTRNDRGELLTLYACPLGVRPSPSTVRRSILSRKLVAVEPDGAGAIVAAGMRGVALVGLVPIPDITRAPHAARTSPRLEP